ncbi:Uncharacterised protein [Klebsiella variicola]|uniref:hypothetical protein n=1 Tax=Klebsiella variicola TaxID=244366 RepID=UPI000E2CC92F|nr:hypothetical protein [Klebsiella variicola]SXE51760.1 Uncharacterised protein [Klebsiella variicola]
MFTAHSILKSIIEYDYTQENQTDNHQFSASEKNSIKGLPTLPSLMVNLSMTAAEQANGVEIVLNDVVDRLHRNICSDGELCIALNLLSVDDLFLSAGRCESGSVKVLALVELIERYARVTNEALGTNLGESFVPLKLHAFYRLKGMNEAASSILLSSVTVAYMLYFSMRLVCDSNKIKGAEGGRSKRSKFKDEAMQLAAEIKSKTPKISQSALANAVHEDLKNKYRESAPAEETIRKWLGTKGI